MTDHVYSGPTPPALKNGEQTTKEEVDKDGSRFVKASPRDAVISSVGVGAITNGPIDFILLSADATVTAELADMPSNTTLAFFLVAGMWHPFPARRITAISTGAASAIFAWARKRT